MGALALFLVLAGGGAYAAFDPVGDDGDIDACFEKKSGDLDLLKGNKCGKGEKRVTWSEQGPAGPAGQQGPEGEQGLQGEQGPPGPATGPASGDLTGNYPDPRVASGAVAHQELGCEGNGNGDAMVRAGTVCVDKYEASVWSEPDGGIQYGIGAVDDYPCNDNGQNCTNIYARSIAGVKPSANITWFQAQQALANVGKRLPTNAEWQAAVAGTPDPGTDNGSTDCNISDDGFPANDPVNAGSRSSCVSNHDAFDMVGNLWEWVADWDEQADACANWPAGYGTDFTCFGDGTPSHFPGALGRGGDFTSNTSAGPFAVGATGPPSDSIFSVGFRGAR